MRAIAVVGYSGSGKTLVVESLVRGLVERGYSVATIKHVRGERVDLATKDTWRHVQAGSSLVVALAEGETVEITPKRTSLGEALSKLRSFDFVVVEGFKEEFPGPRVIAAKNVSEVLELVDELSVAISGLIGRESREAIRGIPVIDPGDSEALARLAVEKALTPPACLDCGKCGYESCKELAIAALRGETSPERCIYLAGSGKVELEVDGRPVPLNEFVSAVFERVVAALVECLRGVREYREVKVRLVVRKRT